MEKMWKSTEGEVGSLVKNGALKTRGVKKMLGSVHGEALEVMENMKEKVEAVKEEGVEVMDAMKEKVDRAAEVVKEEGVEAVDKVKSFFFGVRKDSAVAPEVVAVTVNTTELHLGLGTETDHSSNATSSQYTASGYGWTDAKAATPAIAASKASAALLPSEIHEQAEYYSTYTTMGKRMLNIEEYDVEKVLQEQETHDLICPNCNSCITRRVILRRKRKLQLPEDPTKKPQQEETPGPEGAAVTCLSCLMVFFPKDCRANIIRFFQKKAPGPEAPGSTSNPDVAVSMPVVTTPLVEPPVPPRDREWDVLKAIVYGGLVESIASLSVVSSAASSGAKTLSVFVLGMANLVGGLPVIFHSLNDLKQQGDVEESDGRLGRYAEQLGRRARFPVHIAVAMLSYLLFGLLPPAVYGFAFLGSDSREYKMAAVAGASLLCIAVLALAKAHVSTPRTYGKTLLYYLTTGVGASGLSFVAGEMITRLLAHFGLVDHGTSPPALAMVMSSGSNAWGSY